MTRYQHTKLAAILLAGSFLSLAASAAQATTINFDGGSGVYELTDGYGGLNWSNMFALDSTNYSASGYDAGVVSPDGVAFNSFANPASFSVAAGSTFTFNNFFMTAAWNDNLNVSVQGYLNGNLVNSSLITLLATAPKLFTFNWTGIDTVLLTSFGGTPHSGYSGDGVHFALDNLTVNVAVSSVPVPAALPLLVTGIAGLGVLSRRRAKRKAA